MHLQIIASSYVAIYSGWWQSWGAAPQHGHVVPCQQDGQPLSQLPGQVLLLLAGLPCQLPPKLGNHIQGGLMPATKGVHSQGNEADGLGCAAVIVLSHLGIESVPHPAIPILGHLVNECTL